MRPTDRTVQVEGNLPGQKVTMGFDEGSIAHIMGVLTDLYSNKPLAVIREYSTNAWDSHVEAGVDRPIEVYTPTALSQFFRVKDYGVGLSVDDIERIYAMYGASTKRDTNEQTGMLGLGSKSALTYTNQFMLIGIKGGVKVTVSVSREADGTGAMTIVDTCATDEPNGVEIVVPAALSANFHQTAAKFFSYWDESRYLLNGSTVIPATVGYEEMFPGVFVKIGDIYNLRGYQDMIVMGGVSYPVDSNRLGGDERPWRMIAYVNIGDINFTPSREALQYTPNTIATVDELGKKIDAKIVADIEEKIAKAETFGEAMRIRDKYKVAIPSRVKLTYKGHEIPGAVPLNKIDVLTTSGGSYGRGKYGISQWDTYSGGINTHVAIVMGDEELSVSRKTKIRRWADQNGMQTVKRFILLRKDKATGKMQSLEEISPFLDEVKTYDWSDVKVVRDPNSYTYGSLGPQLVHVTHKAKDGKILHTSVNDVSQWAGKKFVHFSPTDKIDPSYVHKTVDLFDVVAVELSAGRHAKLSRNTGSEHIYSYVRKECDGIEKNITDIDYIKMFLESNRNKWYDGYVAFKSKTLISDPDVDVWVDACQSDYTHAAKVYIGFKGLKVKTGLKDPTRKYVLFREMFNYYTNFNKAAVEEALFYMNAAYAAGRI